MNKSSIIYEHIYVCSSCFTMVHSLEPPMIKCYSRELEITCEKSCFKAKEEYSLNDINVFDPFAYEQLEEKKALAKTKALNDWIKKNKEHQRERQIN